MSEVENLILQAVKEMCDAHKEGIKGIQLNIEASQTITGKALQSINDHLAKLNGSVVDLQKESNARLEVVKDFRNLETKLLAREKWFRRNLFYLLLGLVIVVLGVVVAYDVVGLRGIAEIIK